jgi:hypothetical protein
MDVAVPQSYTEGLQRGKKIFVRLRVFFASLCGKALRGK